MKVNVVGKKAQTVRSTSQKAKTLDAAKIAKALGAEGPIKYEDATPRQKMLMTMGKAWPA